MITTPQFTLLPKWNGDYRRLPAFLASLAIYVAMVVSLIIIVSFTNPDSTLLAVIMVCVVIVILAFSTGHQLAVSWGRTYNMGLRDKWVRILMIVSVLIPYLGVVPWLMLLLLPEGTFGNRTLEQDVGDTPPTR